MAAAGEFVAGLAVPEEKESQNSTDDVSSECSTFIENSELAPSEECLSDHSSEHDDEVETMIIFDWDDTLFPTSWLHKQGLLDEDAVLHEDKKEQLQRLADSSLRTLNAAMQYGRVVIVTNALEGWVERCCEKFMPSVMQAFDEVDIVSARSAYENHTASPSEWKRLAFEDEYGLLECSGAQKFNVLSLGDSLYEQHAVMSLCKKNANCFGKSMKFLANPTLEQLIAQHDFVASSIVDVAEHNGNLDVEIAL
jgi:hypothetical protein